MLLDGAVPGGRPAAEEGVVRLCPGSPQALLPSPFLRSLAAVSPGQTGHWPRNPSDFNHVQFKSIEVGKPREKYLKQSKPTPLPSFFNTSPFRKCFSYLKENNLKD